MNGLYSIVNYSPNMITPEINLILPQSQSYCTDLILDLTKSYGSCGRDWKYKYIQVYKNNIEANTINDFLNNNLDTLFYYPISIPSIYLEPSIYTINVVLCNFLESCSTNTKQVTITEQNDTIININMGLDKIIKRNQELEIISEVSLIGCDNLDTDFFFTEKINLILHL